MLTVHRRGQGTNRCHSAGQPQNDEAKECEGRSMNGHLSMYWNLIYQINKENASSTLSRRGALSHITF